MEFLNINIKSSDNFPSAQDLKTMLDTNNFNRVLELIRLRIIDANNRNENFIRINNPEFIGFTNKTICDVKSFLVNKGYIIANIENDNLAQIGWRLSWC
jgi:hypothetical protein